MTAEHLAPGITAPGHRSVAILVQDGSLERTPPVERLKLALIRALDALDAQVLVAPGAHLARHLEQLPADLGLVFFAESTSSLEAARQAAGSAEATFCLMVAPNTFAHPDPVAPSWAQHIASVPVDSTVFLTDSPLSRAVIENALSAFRVDVRVVTPQPEYEMSVDGPSHTDPKATAVGSTAAFEMMKQWAPGEALPQHSGMNWDFSPREVTENLHPGSPLGTVAIDAEKTLVANATEIARLLNHRNLQGQPLHVGVLGHKLSFIDELARDLSRASGSTVELDEWTSLSAPPDVKRAKDILARSDVLIGEWGRPNNVWIQRHARADKRLIVRVHRYEVTTKFPFAIDLDRYDSAVVIVPWVGRALVQNFGWPQDKLVYIPNYVNTSHFRREKLPGAEFTLGIVGITPDLKRLDLALDLLAALRSEDLRYTLRVRGALPPQHIHWSTNPAISEQWETVLFRLRVDPMLRGAVHFDAPGRDMAAWFEQIGVVLSTSDLEGSHVALAEGMASGALPISRPWPGIRTLWPAECVHETLESAVDQVLRSRDREYRHDVVDRLGAHPSLDQDRVLQAWWDLVHGDRQTAQSAFGPVDWHTDLYEPVNP